MRASTSEGIEWRTKYPQYNAANLETEGVLQVNGQSYIFVSQHHPVVALLHQKAEHLNADILQQQLIDWEWYKITRQVMNTCCATLRSQVLSKVSSRDLNNFSVQIHRIGNKEWNDIKSNDELLSLIPDHIMDSEDQVKITTVVKGILKPQFSFTARMELQYEVSV